MEHRKEDKISCLPLKVLYDDLPRDTKKERHPPTPFFTEFRITDIIRTIRTDLVFFEIPMHSLAGYIVIIPSEYFDVCFVPGIAKDIVPSDY